MKTYITFIAILIIILNAYQSFSQEVVFEYDESGNRQSRTIVGEEIETISEAVFDTTFLKEDEIIENEIVKYSTIIGDQIVNIYPNPTIGTLKLDFEGWKKELEVMVQLHSLDGNLIFNKRITKRITKLDIVNQPNGTYILTIIFNKEKETWKIIKQ